MCNPFFIIEKQIEWLDICQYILIDTRWKLVLCELLLCALLHRVELNSCWLLLLFLSAADSRPTVEENMRKEREESRHVERERRENMRERVFVAIARSHYWYSTSSLLHVVSPPPPPKPPFVLQDSHLEFLLATGHHPPAPYNYSTYFVYTSTYVCMYHEKRFPYVHNMLLYTVVFLFVIFMWFYYRLQLFLGNEKYQYSYRIFIL